MFVLFVGGEWGREGATQSVRDRRPRQAKKANGVHGGGRALFFGREAFTYALLVYVPTYSNTESVCMLGIFPPYVLYKYKPYIKFQILFFKKIVPTA